MTTGARAGGTREWLRGQVLAVPTPFDARLEIDEAGLRVNIEAVIARGVRTGGGVLLVAGAAGEFPVLSPEERVRVMRISVDAAAGRVPVLSSVQHTDLRIGERLAAEAQDAGIAGLQVGVPYYYPATNDDFLRTVERIGAASSLPLMVYSTWWEGGLAIDGRLLRRLAELPHVEAVKWSAPTYDAFTEGIVAVRDRLVIIDNQAMHVWGHLLGTDGFVTHVGNFWPVHMAAIWSALERRDYPAARDLLLLFKPAWGAWAGRVMAETGGEAPFIKAAMSLAGLAAGGVRAPSVLPSDARIAELRDLFVRAGVPVAASA